MRAYLAKLVERGLSPRTAARRLSALRQFHRFLVSEGIRGDDPMSRIDAPRLGRPLPKTLSEDEVKRLIDAAATLPSPERERLEAGSGSELAVFERRGAEVEIVASARQWAVRRIAAAMLAGAMERYRQAQSDPLMARAGELFAGLTLGAFSGLTQDYGEDDRPRLVGVRPGGAHVVTLTAEVTRYLR